MKKIVLIIEDNLPIRESASELLKLDGYEVLEAQSGESALQIIEAQKPDVIICDVIMPGMDGYQFYEHLKKKERPIPFIISTAKTEKTDRQKARELGIRYYLTKPFDESMLLQCIEDSLAGC